MAVKPLTLADFLADLDQYTDRVPLAELTERLAALDITEADVRPFANFGPHTYQRNLMHSGPAYSALILCWRSGQRSPIHDHFGSSCGVKVIKGTARETYFDRTPHGYVYATSARDLPEGGVCGSQDDDMHEVANLQPPGRDLITLHVYSPPLTQMHTYSLDSTVRRLFNDPVHSVCDGAGI
ncbi:MAG: cysteine dioxygenase family protein [Phycisphaerales bacterium]|nr:cysteine dioxygenase family protein [Phycisphaerales bacterium]